MPEVEEPDIDRAGNILLITADQWRWDFCSANGFQCETTPAIDMLVSDATSFDRHYANTTPCGPARASLLTGMYAHNHRSLLNGTPLDDSFTNIALEARKSGYQPALFGYTDTSADPRHRACDDPALSSYEGVLPGFDPTCLLTEDNLPWLSFLEMKGYEVPGPGYAVYRPLGDGDPTAPARYRAEDSDTAWLVDQCIAHLRQRRAAPGSEPFFIHLSLLRPHPPWIAPAPYHAMFDPSDMPAARRPLSRSDQAAIHPYLDWQLARIRQASFFASGPGLAAELDDRAVARIRATYAGLVREVDANLGRLFAVLRELDYYERTLIVLTSDHGEQLGDHFLFGKLGFFDESYRIPLIVRDPGRPAGHGRRVNAFTESIDIMPTILDWIGRPVPGQCDGLALGEWLDGGMPAQQRTAAHWSFDFRNPLTQEAERRFGLPSDACTATVRREAAWKYVHFAGLPPLLFNLEADPTESVDLSANADHRDRRMAMAEAMLAWRMQNGYRALANILLTETGPVEHRRIR